MTLALCSSQMSASTAASLDKATSDLPAASTANDTFLLPRQPEPTLLKSHNPAATTANPTDHIQTQLLSG